VRKDKRGGRVEQKRTDQPERCRWNGMYGRCLFVASIYPGYTGQQYEDGKPSIPTFGSCDYHYECRVMGYAAHDYDDFEKWWLKRKANYPKDSWMQYNPALLWGPLNGKTEPVVAALPEPEGRLCTKDENRRCMEVVMDVLNKRITEPEGQERIQEILNPVPF